MSLQLSESGKDSLLDACRRGDPEAFATLFVDYYDRVFSFAARFSGDPTLAADVTQEVFLKLLKRVEQFRGEADFKSWLYRIVLNTCIDNHRKAQRWVPLDDVDASTMTLAPQQESEAARRQAAARVRKAVSTLSPRLRAPLLLRYVSGLTYEEIGRVLGLPCGTVASRLCRAQRCLEREVLTLRTGRSGR